jgi:hypothetical protein
VLLGEVSAIKNRLSEDQRPGKVLRQSRLRYIVHIVVSITAICFEKSMQVYCQTYGFDFSLFRGVENSSVRLRERF